MLNHTTIKLVAARNTRLGQGLLRSIFFVATALLLTQPLGVSAESAAAYGTDTYGSCNYNQVCAGPPTVVTLPSGLDVAVNLSDGQTVPNDQYALQATPLNGQGGSFDHIDFYVDDQLIATVKPDETGTARWVWNTHDHPGTTIKIVVTGTDGQAVTKTYHVHIAAPAQTTPSPEPHSVGSGSSNTKPASPVQRVINGATHFIAALPAPLVRTFPYWLFLVLLANFVVLAVQLLKELREYRLAKLLLARQRDVASTKHVLLQLLSHYLRTPVTVINGGIEMLATEAQDGWKQLSRSLSENTELLITQARLEAAAVDDNLPAAEQQAAALRFWRRPGLFVPILFIGMVAALFDYLANRTSKLNISQTNLITQVLVFFSLTIFTYLAFRLVQLRRQNAQELARLTAAEAALAQTQDDLVAEGVGLLEHTVEQIGSQSAALPDDPAKKFIRDGYQRLTELLSKLQLAASVRSAHISKPFTAMPFSQLLGQAVAPLGAKASERHIQLPAGTDGAVKVRDPDLLVRVVSSVLDNAVAYSPDGANIEAACYAGKDATTLTITDHGKGIPEDKLNSLFAPFQKLEGADTFDHEGMGFSLYLDRLLMKYLGGSIRIASPQGHGTQVTLELPNA